jgi:hypothetical protein
VFKRGTEKALIGLMPVGGHVHPSSGVGARLLWKNAQKNAKKNRTSEAINRIIPQRSPKVTGKVWNPINVASRTTSRHHCSIVKIIINTPIKRGVMLLWWNQ